MTKYKYTTNQSSDFSDNLDVHPAKQDILLVKDVDAVSQSIRNLMFTGPYERRFRPGLGSGLQKYLFEPITSSTADSIRSSIIRMIQNFETRAELLDVIVTVTPDYNSYSATIKYRTLNRVEPITINAILERIR